MIFFGGKAFKQLLQTRAEVSPGHVVKKPEVMVAVQIETTGLKAD